MEANAAVEQFEMNHKSANKTLLGDRAEKLGRSPACRVAVAMDNGNGFFDACRPRSQPPEDDLFLDLIKARQTYHSSSCEVRSGKNL